MPQQRRIKGEGAGVPLTIWISEDLKDAIEVEAQRLKTKRSTVARRVLEAAFKTKNTLNG